MADFIKTIANSVNLFGGNPSSKWGQANYPYTFTWGTTKWGEGTFSIVFSVDKLIQNALAPDTALIFQQQKLISNNLQANGAMSSEILTDGVWRVVFVSDTINIEDRDMASWTSGNTTTSTFSCLPAGSTNWT